MDIKVTISEQERSAARLQSYTFKAVIALLLYFVAWLPGIIANFLFYSDGKRMQRIAGESLPGVGCLSAMLWFNAIVIALVVAMGLCSAALFGLDTFLPDALYAPLRWFGLG